MQTLYDAIANKDQFGQVVYDAIAHSLKQLTDDQVKQLVYDWSHNTL